jgi:hypothetical protein
MLKYESKSETSWKFRNVVSKNGEDQQGRSYEELSIALSQGGEEYTTYNKQKEG